MVGRAELSDFELMGPEQVVDSIWRSGDVVMHEVVCSENPIRAC